MTKLIPWQQRVSDLLALGWNPQTLGDAIGLHFSTVYDLANGRAKEPRGYAAVRLYQLAGKRPPSGPVSLRALR